VVGKIDREAKSLQISELHILYNNHFESKAIICLVNAVLEYDEHTGKLYGSLRSQTAGHYHAECAKGSLSFLNKDELVNLFSPPKDSIPNPTLAATPTTTSPPIVSKKKQPAHLPQKDKVKEAKVEAVAKITEGKDKVYYWNNDRILLQIFDGTTVDNDIVSVYYNGEKVLNNYSLRKEKKELLLPIGGNELNIISIEANNEGGDPPNTANILLFDGDISYEIIAHNKTGSRAVIRFKRKP